MDSRHHGKEGVVTTQPAQPAAQPVATHPVITLRGIISILETASFVIATILAALNNGQDFKRGVTTALVGFIAHGVNHNAGGSPV
jgi:hypothetical protein